MTIRLLPPEVADAIAAGEVVERPASVVKELVENGLDAGARSVAVDVQGAGRTLIRVADDGSGIHPGELALAFTRHATSKLRSISDLSAIASLGFRGEALASIAAVADVECASRGHRIRVKAGAVVEEGIAPLAPGTVVEVRDLFGTTPARLRFLKSPATEEAAISRCVAAYALCRPDVRFRVEIDSRPALSTAGDGRLRHAVAAVYGKACLPELLEVEATAGEAAAIRGVVSQPRLSRASRDAIQISVNRRPISSRSLAFAVEDCYRDRLERGRYPLAALDLAVDPAQVDVNVHPTKREVRFRDEGAVFAALQRAVRAALTGSEPYRLQVAAAAAGVGGFGDHRPLTVHEPRLQLEDASLDRELHQQVLRPLGQVQDGYLVAEGADGIVLVDQHAAHERVLYNRFLTRLAGGETVSQPLLVPEAVGVNHDQMATAREREVTLQRLGFWLEAFGPRTLRVAAAPAEVPVARLPETVLDVLAVLGRERSDDGGRKVAASLACHAAVRFGDSLEVAEQRRLLTELVQAADAVTCPHGRPTQLVIGWTDLKRHFGRNY